VQKEKFVQIGQIVSVPMLAIWAGMTAIPWQGPPPVSLRGFGHLLIHTRQIDMVMADQNMLEHYRHKIIADLATIAPQAEHAHEDPDPHPAG